MAKKETVQSNLIRKAVDKGEATSIENTPDGQVAQNVKGHGWAEIIEGVPYKGATE